MLSLAELWLSKSNCCCSVPLTHVSKYNCNAKVRFSVCSRIWLLALVSVFISLKWNSVVGGEAMKTVENFEYCGTGIACHYLLHCLFPLPSDSSAWTWTWTRSPTSSSVQTRGKSSIQLFGYVTYILIIVMIIIMMLMLRHMPVSTSVTNCRCSSSSVVVLCAQKP